MFKILILQRFCNLPDEQTEYQIIDRLSFTRFLSLWLGSKIPDFTTVGRFREALITADVVKRWLDRFIAELARQGVLTKAGVVAECEHRRGAAAAQYEGASAMGSPCGGDDFPRVDSGYSRSTDGHRTHGISATRVASCLEFRLRG